MGGFQHILIPLDGTDVSELAIEAAREAVAKGGRLTFLRVVDILGDHYLPDDADKKKIREQQIHPAVEYLDEIKKRLGKTELQLDVAVAGGAPADAILEVAREKGVNAIAMCTHTEAKIRQFLMGSVAQRVMRRGTVPVILVHPAEDE